MGLTTYMELWQLTPKKYSEAHWNGGNDTEYTPKANRSGSFGGGNSPDGEMVPSRKKEKCQMTFLAQGNYLLNSSHILCEVHWIVLKKI